MRHTLRVRHHHMQLKKFLHKCYDIVDTDKSNSLDLRELAMVRSVFFVPAFFFGLDSNEFCCLELICAPPVYAYSSKNSSTHKKKRPLKNLPKV